MNNPYTDVNWQRTFRVPSATHMHLMSQVNLENAYRYGIRHFPVSNYYPSAPYDATTRQSDFRLRQWWPARRDGKVLEPPINWNEVVNWIDEVEEPYRSAFPFKETGPVYEKIPDDAILSHNAEHHGFSNSRAHICSPGSSFASGTFDVHQHYRTRDHGFPVGFGGTWQEAFEGMIAHLDYPDGGGITINHPTWFTRFSDAEVLEMLDFDERVLGIEIYNDYSGRKNWFENPDYKAPDEPEVGFSLRMWDRVLATGRRCWGFCVPDHSAAGAKDWNGRCVLLVSEFTEHACLKAYREGRFYGCLKNNGLTVQSFEATNAAISVQLNRAAKVRFISDAGELCSGTGERMACDIPQKNGAPGVTYVRVEVSDDSGERLFLQPVMW